MHALRFCLFVCVEILRSSQPNGVMSSVVSLPNHTFTGQAYSSKRLTSIVHILSPETDKCPSWISGRETMTVENISWSISTKECCRPRVGIESVTSWSPVGRRIQLSHRGRRTRWGNKVGKHAFIAWVLLQIIIFGGTCTYVKHTVCTCILNVRTDRPWQTMQTHIMMGLWPCLS